MVADSINIIMPITGEWKARLTFVTMFTTSVIILHHYLHV